jgi:hypothetical protein
MAIGREILQSGEIPQVDAYSQAMAGGIYSSYQMYWLADVGLYSVYNLGGAALSVLVQSLIITLAYAAIFLLCFRVSRSLRVAAFGTIFAAAMGLSNWNLRPQIVTYFLGALFLWAIYEYRMRPRKGLILVFPAAMMLWVNCHGSFPIGLLLLGIWLLDEVVQAVRVRWYSRRSSGDGSGGDLRGNEDLRGDRPFLRALPPVIALVITVLAALVNPLGIGVFQYIVTMSTNTIVQNLVPEWAPPSFNTTGGTTFIVGLLLSSLILAFSPRRPGFFQVIFFLCFSILALKTTRGIIWYGLVMAPVLSDHIAALSAKLRRPGSATGSAGGVPAINTAFLILIFLMGFVSMPWFKHSLRFPESKAGLIHVETPVEATKFLLERRPEPPLFHAMSYGSYLIWAAQPEYRVFVDSRIELYPREIWHDYLRLSNAQYGWEKRLDHYGINTLMLSRVEQPVLVDSARASGAWQELYSDRYAVIFARAGLPAPSGE